MNTLETNFFRCCGVFLWLLVGAASAVASDLPREVVIRNVEFVLVPAGNYLRHNGVESDRQPHGAMSQHWVDDFYIAKFEARARDLVEFMNAVRPKAELYAGDLESCSMRRDKNGQYVLVDPSSDLPATHLSWVLARQWAEWMGFRLPTESEWEKAARGGDQRRYPWGDAPPDDTYANFQVASSCLVWPVDRSAKGRSPYGVYNLSGNIREYVADWHEGDADAGLAAFRREKRSVYGGELSAHIRPRLLKGGRWASRPEQIEISARLGWVDEEEGFQCNGARFAVDAEVVRKRLADGTATAVVR